MYSRGRLTVLAAAALLACAHARPGANDIGPTNVKPLDVVVSKSAMVEIKSTSDKPEESSAAVTEESVFKAVNERYPSAVLFGGTCGGTIISPNWVLTAGHCTLFTGGHYIIAGTNKTDDGSGVYLRVKRLVIHPLFSVGPYWLDADRFNIKQVAARWDFLLVELEEPLVLNGKTIAAAKLDDKPVAGSMDVAYAGYGTEHQGGVMRNDMHAMELTTQSDEVCSSLIEYDSKDMLCAKGRPPRYDSACNGDSGSGLVDNNGRLVGIASWVEDDAHVCRNGALVFFSRVSSVRDWIKEVTKV